LAPQALLLLTKRLLLTAELLLVARQRCLTRVELTLTLAEFTLAGVELGLRLLGRLWAWSRWGTLVWLDAAIAYCF